MRWFEQLFGFVEGDWKWTQSRFVVHGDRLHSLVNGRSFAIGQLGTPTLQALRDRVDAGLRSGTLQTGSSRVHHEAIGDVLELHARPENEGALFQVASQLNCLEFVSDQITPEHGVTGYAVDMTQGPACSLAAAPATVYRNYFAPVGDQVGQTAECQLNNLDDLEAVLGPFWIVRNGYTHSDEVRLALLVEALATHGRDDLLGHVKIGLHQSVGVSFARRYIETVAEPRVSQAFCSAISCAYTALPLRAWQPLATLVLDAMYEATLLAAAVDRADGQGSGKVWLTFLGGGVFGNRPAWIAAAIRRALHRTAHLDLDVHIAHYRRIDHRMTDAIAELE